MCSKMPQQQQQDYLGAAGLLAYLENQLSVLELAGGGADEESRAKLQELREALQVNSQTQLQQEAGQFLAEDEQSLEALLDSMEKQLTAVEAALAGLGTDSEARQLLAESMGVWMGEGQQGEGIQHDTHSTATDPQQGHGQEACSDRTTDIATSGCRVDQGSQAVVPADSKPQTVPVTPAAADATVLKGTGHSESCQDLPN